MTIATRTTRPVSPSVTPTPVIRSAVRVPRTPVAPPRPLQVAPPVLRLNAGLGGGMPLPVAVQAPIEQSFGADLSGVRVHSGSEAAQAARMMSARAFAYGSNIVLGGGEQATDLPLIAHEAAHTLQQRAVPTIQRFSSPHDSPHEREAHAAAHAVVQGQSFAISQFTTPQIQRLGLSDALDYFADKANNIPGFRMFTIVLGINPITMNRVERSPANIMRAIVEFMPGGALITQALDEYGVFDKVGRWVEEQITSLGMVGSSIKAAISQFLDSLSWSDIFNLGDVWERAKRIFTQPIDQIINFVKGLVNGILDFIKDAILKPLAKLAEGTRGWDLLIAVLGKNPITGEAVPQNAETLIGGFMKLIGQEEIWENMKKANAIGRAWTWFKTALSELLGFVQQIPRLFIAAVKSLELADIVKPWNAFKKVATVFGDFIGNFISWAGKTVWKLLEIIFEVVAPAALPYLKKAQAAFRTILKAPAVFVGHLVRAGKRGFEKFATNFFEHLKTALIRWITGPLGDAGVYIPKSFSLMEIVKLVLSVLGLTWQNVRSKLIKIIPEPVLVGLEKTAGILVTLIKDGPAAAWEQIKAELTELKDQLISQVVEMVTSEVVKAAVKKLVMMLNPAGAFVQAIIAIYNTITFFVEKIKQIAAVVGSFIDSISAIANGQTEPAANRVEQTMANTLTLVISFLAKFAGLGDIPQKIVGVIKKIRQPIDKGLDKIVTWLGKVLDKVKGAIHGTKVQGSIEDQARQLFMNRLGTQEKSKDEVQNIARSLEPQLRSIGVKRIEVGQTDQDGSYDVRLEASPLRPFLAMVPATRRGSMRAVANIAVSGAPLTMEEMQAAMDPGRRLNQATGQLVPIQSSYRLIQPPAGRGQSLIGAAVILPQPSNSLHVVSRATGDYTIAAASSHAEQYLVHFIREQSWRSRITGIIIENYDLNPCQYCGGALISLMNMLNAGKTPANRVHGIIRWRKPWAEEDISIIRNTINQLQAATWIVEPAAVDQVAYERAYAKSVARGARGPRRR